jgi:hypothetical protein
MIQFDENDLFYKDYENSIGNLPDYVAIEDLKILNIRERYHVIYFCDAYLKRYRLDKEIENFQKVEHILRMSPQQYCDKKQLFNYILNNWSLVTDSVMQLHYS